MTTWKKAITKEMKFHDENWEDIIAQSPEDFDPNITFSAGFGTTKGQPFTVWTKRRVYFPACFDGSEWCASVPRDPCDEVIGHIGGGCGEEKYW